MNPKRSCCLYGFDFDFDFDFEIEVIAKIPGTGGA